MELHERLFSEEKFESGFRCFIYRGVRKSWHRRRTLSEDAVNEAAQHGGPPGVIDGGTRHCVMEEERPELRERSVHRSASGKRYLWYSSCMIGFRSSSLKARTPFAVNKGSITSRTAECTIDWNMMAVSIL